MSSVVTLPVSRSLVIALIGTHSKSVMLLHAARKQAQELGGSWRVLHIETTEDGMVSEEAAQERLLRLSTLAEQMGGEVQHVQAATFEQGVRQTLATEKDRLACLVVGSSGTQRRLRHFRFRPPWEQVLRLAGQHVRVEIIPLGAPVFKIRREWPKHLHRTHPRYFVYTLMAVTVAYLIAAILETLLPPALFRINIQNISLLFMIACAFTAGRYGLMPGLLAAVLGAITYNYYYVPPYHSLDILAVAKGLNIALLFFAAALIAIFTGQARLYGERSARREQGTQVLLMLYRMASSAFSREQALKVLQQKLGEMLNIDVAFFLPSVKNSEQVEAVMPAQLELDEYNRTALEACWKEMKTTGLAAPTYAMAQWRFKPLITSTGIIGVMAVRPRDGEKLEMWLFSLLAAIADQIAVIIEHFELTHSMESARLREEREKLRAMLLSSVSHDLKTPLSGIIGSLSVHKSVGNRLSPERRAELLSDALEEAQRLDSFITNILDMTRLESGKVKFRPEWNDINSHMRQVVKRMQHRLQARKVIITPCPEAIEVYMDAVLTEQVLQNLLDNACKYTPDGTQISITVALREGGGVMVTVRDYGKGIPADKLHTIFDKYARLQKEDMQVAGTGLGLAICKSIMEAQGGKIIAANHPEGGAAFTISFPQWRAMAVAEAPVDEVAAEEDVA